MTEQVELRTRIPAALMQALDDIVAARTAVGVAGSLDAVVAAALTHYVSMVAPRGQPDNGVTLPGVLPQTETDTGGTTDSPGPPEHGPAPAGNLRTLLAQWLAEDAQDPAAAAAEWEDFQAALNANRAASGEPPLFA